MTDALQTGALLIGLAVFPVCANAGPAILSTAQPTFQDPLSGARAPSVDQADEIGSGQQNPAQTLSSNVGTGDSGFTIIGDQGTSGLEEPESDALIQAVRGGLLDRAQSPDASDSRLNADETTAETGGSAADIVRALVNSVPGRSAGVGGRSTDQGANENLVASVIDSTVTDLVITLLNPEQTTDEMVTFSIAGFGDFALLLLQESNSLFIVDMNGGSAIKFAQGEQSAVPSAQIRQPAGATPARLVGMKSNTLQRVISFLEDNVLPFIQSPITLAALGLFSIIWIIWRLSAQSA